MRPSKKTKRAVNRLIRELRRELLKRPNHELLTLSPAVVAERIMMLAELEVERK